MAKRHSKKRVEIFYYNCSITGEKFKVNREAPSPDELVSVNAFYEMNDDQDDRPEKIKKFIATQEPVVFEDEDEDEEEIADGESEQEEKKS